MQCLQGACISQETRNHSRSFNQRNLIQGIGFSGDGKDEKPEEINSYRKALHT